MIDWWLMMTHKSMGGESWIYLYGVYEVYIFSYLSTEYTLKLILRNVLYVRTHMCVWSNNVRSTYLTVTYPRFPKKKDTVVWISPTLGGGCFPIEKRRGEERNSSLPPSRKENVLQLHSSRLLLPAHRRRLNQKRKKSTLRPTYIFCTQKKSKEYRITEYLPTEHRKVTRYSYSSMVLIPMGH